MMKRPGLSPLAPLLAQTLRLARPPLAAAAVFSLVINLLALTVPLHMMHIYDHVLTSRSAETLLFITLLAFGLLAALGLLDLFRARLMGRLANRADHAIGARLFEAAVEDRLAGRADSPGQPLRDLESLRNFISSSALTVLFDAPWAPVFLVIIFLLHPLLGVVALVGATVLMITTVINERATRRQTATATADSIAAASFADAALRNAEVLTAMGMTPAITARWQQRYRQAAHGHAATADRAGLFVALAKFWRPFLQVSMLATGAALALGGQITPGVMIAASIIMSRALAPVEGAIGSWRGFITARGAYRRVREALSRHGEPAARMALPAPRGALEVHQLMVAPPRVMKPVLKGVSFALAPGEALGVIGPNGSGKSTLARALVGAWPILAGEIRLDGAALGELNRTRIGHAIGYLPQDIELFEGTVAENIARFGARDPDGVVAAARQAGLHDVILRLPQGYDTPVGPGGEALSGGQRQRIALARALYGRPALLILDEPNASLDAEGEDALMAAIAAAKAQGAAILIIAHRPNMVAVVDRLMVLRDGTVEMIGPRAEVLARVTRPPPTPPRDGAVVAARFGGPLSA